MARVIPSEGAGGGAGGISGSGDPTFVTTADPNTKYTDSATGDIYIHVGASANNYDWMNVTQGGIRNPRTLLGSSVLTLWVDTIFGEGISYRTDAGIDRLYDLSGNSADHAQNTDADQPTINATAAPGSTAEIDFGSGTDKKITKSAYTCAASGSRPTIVTVARLADGHILADNLNGAAYYERLYASTSIFCGAHNAAVQFSAPTLDANYHVFVQRYASTVNTLHVDGVLATTTGSPPAGWTAGDALPADMNNSRIGVGSSLSGGGLCAKLVANRQLTTEEMVEIGKYYEWKRSLAVTDFAA